MKNDENSHETLFRIFISLVRISKKFNELEKSCIDVGNGEKLYPSQIHLIEAIGNNRGKNVTEISKKFQITKGAVSQVVNKLHNDGFINKKRNKESGKEIILSLTEKGQMVFEIQNKLHNKVELEFIDYLENFTPEQVDSFLQMLSKIEDFIDIFLNNEF
ncbi:MAG: MarR family transcriptional regulator [Methanobacterium sp.]|uniref:MarR family winged helix-turn-helix transcriptional regulator n=1 Tax=Methanobacterium sp. TaxID=2164 RepID=UPI003D64F1B9|nr:MarR family transcriptional regulator [Methanobacterium sp.]